MAAIFNIRGVLNSSNHINAFSSNLEKFLELVSGVFKSFRCMSPSCYNATLAELFTDKPMTDEFCL